MLESYVLFIESVWINNISVMGITIAFNVFVHSTYTAHTNRLPCRLPD